MREDEQLTPEEEMVSAAALAVLRGPDVPEEKSTASADPVAQVLVGLLAGLKELVLARVEKTGGVLCTSCGKVVSSGDKRVFVHVGLTCEDCVVRFSKLLRFDDFLRNQSKR